MVSKQKANVATGMLVQTYYFVSSESLQNIHKTGSIERQTVYRLSRVVPFDAHFSSVQTCYRPEVTVFMKYGILKKQKVNF